jgi:AcrR family transcriptional regulator
MVKGQSVTSRPRPPERKRKRSSEGTRALMLEAGERVLQRRLRDSSDEVAGAPLAHIRLTDVAREATAIVAERGNGFTGAVTTGSIYQLWPSQAAFQAELVRHVITATTFPEAQQLLEMLLELFASGSTLSEIIDRLSLVSFESNDSDAFYARLGFLQYAAVPSIKDALHDNVHLFDELDRPIFEAILTYTRRRVRKPFVLKDLWVSIEALVAGYLIRHRVDPDSLRWSMSPGGRSVLSCAVEGAFLAFTEPIEGSNTTVKVSARTKSPSRG